MTPEDWAWLRARARYADWLDWMAVAIFIGALCAVLVGCGDEPSPPIERPACCEGVPPNETCICGNSFVENAPDRNADMVSTTTIALGPAGPASMMPSSAGTWVDPFTFQPGDLPTRTEIFIKPGCSLNFDRDEERSAGEMTHIYKITCERGDEPHEKE